MTQHQMSPLLGQQHYNGGRFHLSDLALDGLQYAMLELRHEASLAQARQGSCRAWQLVADCGRREVRGVMWTSSADRHELRHEASVGRPLVGGLSFHGVSGLCMSSLAHGLPGGIQAQAMRRRPTQAWVSCSRGRITACDPHALRGDQCGEQRGPDLKHSTDQCRVTCVCLGVETCALKRLLGKSAPWLQFG